MPTTTDQRMSTCCPTLPWCTDHDCCPWDCWDFTNDQHRAAAPGGPGRGETDEQAGGAA